jgi:hypothetical protein
MEPSNQEGKGSPEPTSDKLAWEENVAKEGLLISHRTFVATAIGVILAALALVWMVGSESLNPFTSSNSASQTNNGCAQAGNGNICTVQNTVNDLSAKSP